MKSLVTFEWVKYRSDSFDSGRKMPKGVNAPRLEVVVHPDGPVPALAAARERADQDGRLGVQGHTQRVRGRAARSWAVHSDLPDRPLVAAQLDRLVDVADLLMTAPGRVDHEPFQSKRTRLQSGGGSPRRGDGW